MLCRSIKIGFGIACPTLRLPNSMPTPKEKLEIYLQYQDYLTAGQLRDLLGNVDSLYDALHSGMTHTDPRQLALQSRLRISELRTGESITLLLAAGIYTVMKGGAIVT